MQWMQFYGGMLIQKTTVRKEVGPNVQNKNPTPVIGIDQVKTLKETYYMK